MLLTCDACGSDQEFRILENYLFCQRCGHSIPVTMENVYIGEKLKEDQQSSSSQVLKEGAVVIIDHTDHVWHNEIAIICGVKHKFYRLEFGGRRIWVPCGWVKEHEPY